MAKKENKKPAKPEKVKGKKGQEVPARLYING